MAVNYWQTGNLKTVVTVKLNDMHLNHGHWKTQPISVCNAGQDHTIIFIGENEGSSTICTDGYVTYSAADGTKFKLSWNCTMSGSNKIEFSMDGSSGQWERGDVSTTGKFNSDYNWEIRQASKTFVDAPVFAENILLAERCALTSDDTVKKYLAGRSCVYLRDCFDVKGMKDYEKIWCVKNKLFLTPISKGILHRDLVEALLKTNVSGESLKRIENWLAYHDDVMNEKTDGQARKKLISSWAKMRAEMDESSNLSEAVAIEVAGTLLDDDLSHGWKMAVNTYLDVLNSAEKEKRQKAILQIVENRL